MTRSSCSLLALLSLILCGLTFGCCTTPATPTPPRLSTPTDIPETLRPPTGQDRLVHRSAARGFQVYTCTADADGKYAWKVTPDAELLNAAGKKEGRHYAGPTWELEDGSKVTCTKTAEVKQPDACAWLLLKATKAEGNGNGALSHVTYIQRLHTTGGVAPSEPADPAHAGKAVRVPYTADYYFYAAKE